MRNSYLGIAMAQRRRRRFSDLEKQFRESGGTAAPGSRLAGYIDYKKGINKVEIRDTRKLTAAQRKRYGYAIVPFGLTVPATVTSGDRYAASITAYSNQYRKEAGLTDNELGYQDIVGATIQSEIFFPALCRFFINFGTTLSPTSGIVKKEYKRKDGRTITVPFGRTMSDVTDATTGATEATLDDVDYQDVRTSLALALKGKVVGGTTNVITSVTFEPEVWKVGKSDLASPTTV